MFFRLLMESFRRQRRRKMLAGLAILLGTTAVTAMLALATTIGDRIHKELAVYGANIVVYPKADLLDVKVGGVDLKPASAGASLKESDLEKLKTIFWANNITGVSPEVDWNGDASREADPRLFGPIVDLAGKKHLPSEIERLPSSAEIATTPAQVRGLWFDHSWGSLRTGASQLHPWWHLQGSWPVMSKGFAEQTEAVVGQKFAENMGLKLGDTFTVMTPLLYRAGLTNVFRVTGIVKAGDQTDNLVLIPLEYAQSLVGSENAISRVEITARTKPEDAFARVDPDSLPPKQREIWYCRPYANSIAYQIREAIPGAAAEQVRRVEQSEGNVLNRISGLMWLVSAAALLAAGFAVSAAMATAVLERRGEIGLMRSLGASKGAIALLFYAETGLLAIFAGALGYLVGSGLAAWLGARIFAGDGGSAEAVLNPVLLPVVVALALVVAIAGSTPSIRSALRMDPSAILREDA
jgi:putative ABC transport system permease protein